MPPRNNARNNSNSNTKSANNKQRAGRDAGGGGGGVGGGGLSPNTQLATPRPEPDEYLSVPGRSGGAVGAAMTAMSGGGDGDEYDDRAGGTVGATTSAGGIGRGRTTQAQGTSPLLIDLRSFPSSPVPAPPSALPPALPPALPVPASDPSSIIADLLDPLDLDPLGGLNDAFGMDATTHVEEEDKQEAEEQDDDDEDLSQTYRSPPFRQLPLPPPGVEEADSYFHQDEESYFHQQDDAELEEDVNSSPPPLPVPHRVRGGIGVIHAAR